MKAPTTIPATIADLRETADRLMVKATASVDSNNMVDAMLFSKSAGYLRGLAKWMEADSKPAAASETEPLTLNDM